jgi:ssDNA-binding Zn-finger/Zn-ribbon topoisomerase 1
MNVLEIIEKMVSTKTKEIVKIICCPDCGKEMIKRKSKWGDGFWYGCSGYPKCKKTLKI